MYNVNLSGLNIICGHYGSGKTNIAVNLAMMCKAANPMAPVHIADIDIVNPYFRTADAVSMLEGSGVDVLIPEFANTNVDIPCLPPKLVSLFDSGKDDISFIDVGGDDGSVALGMYSHLISRTGYEMIYVINRYRPLIADPQDAYECMLEIEAAARLKCTKIVNNSSLGAETTAEDILESVEYAKKCAEKCGLPLIFHSYCEEYAPDTPEVFRKNGYEKEPLFAIKNATKRLY